MKKKVIRYILSFWVCLTLLLTLYPMKDYPGTKETYYDKVAHFFIFGIFAFLFFNAFEKKEYKRKVFFLSILAGIIFSLLVEFLQKYIPGRNISELDFIAGTMGAMYFSMAAYILTKNNKE